MEDQLHPTVREFKKFINKRPKLIEEIRKNGRSWQEYYEKWVLLGEEDPMWKEFEETEEHKKNLGEKNKQTELFNQLIKYAEKIDLNKVEENINQLNEAIGTVQDLIGQFQSTNQVNRKPRNPFQWSKD